MQKCTSEEKESTSALRSIRQNYQNLKKNLNVAPDAGEDDLDFNIDSNLMDNLNENINLYIHGVYP